MNKSLVIYFVILAALCTVFIAGAKAMGEQGAYLAQGYMMTPAGGIMGLNVCRSDQGLQAKPQTED